MQVKVIQLAEFGDADVLKPVNVEIGQPGPRQVRLRVLATAVNPVDLGTRAGQIIQGNVYPTLHARLPMVLGWDAAGIIEEAGAEVQNWRAGDAVIVMIHQVATQAGTYAEQILVDAELLAPWPGTREATMAASLPLAGLTALQALDRLKLSAGETLFINGPLGAVGSIAAQLAVHANVRVVGAVREQEKEQARKLGLEWTIARGGDLRREIAEVVGGPVDAALDVVGGAVAEQTIEAIRDGGRYATVIPNLEHRGPHTPIRSIIPQTVYIVPDPKGLRYLSELLGKGVLNIPLAAAFPLEQAAEAHRLAASHSTTGKIVLIP